MEFISLKINNFLAIGDAPPLSLSGKGLVLIQGENQDDTSATSNGVGKSSIADALCWALYGETARGVSGDAVINKVAKKNCQVSVCVKDGSTSYRITRYRKDKDYKNRTTLVAWTDADPSAIVDLEKGTEKETQAAIVEIMGCSLSVFMAAIYAGQDVTPDLPKMTDKQLKLLIEEAAGIERIENAYEIARKKSLVAQTNYQKIAGRVEHLKKQLADAISELRFAESKHADFEASREVLANSLRDEAVAQKVQLVEIVTKIKGIDVANLEKRNAEISKALAEHSSKQRESASLAQVLAQAKSKYDRPRFQLETLLADVKRVKSNLDNAEEVVKKPCPECGKPGDLHDLEKYKSAATEKLTGMVRQAGILKSDMERLSGEVASAQKAYDDHLASIPDLSDLGAEQRTITVALGDYAESKRNAGIIKNEIERRLSMAANAMVAENPHLAFLERARLVVESMQGDLTKAENDLVLSEDEVAIFDNVVKVFGPAGVRAHILDTVTPYLNDRTSDYLSALSDGNIGAVWTTLGETAKGELREKFNIDVSNDKGAESFSGLSGGEKRKVRIATMLALQDLVSSRATKPIDLWMGDEIDDALDRAGLERLMGILERKAREKGTVLVISHNDLKDWCDQTVTVVKSGGTSTVEGALCP